MDRPPEEPEAIRVRIPVAQWWVIAISLAVPGMAAGGLVFVSQFFGFRPAGTGGAWLILGYLGGFFLLVLGCSIFAGWMLTAGVLPLHRRFKWGEATLIFLFAQVLLTPVIAGIILAFFMV